MEGVSPALCPRYHRAVEIIGRRWTGAVLSLMLSGATRYSELRKAIPDMSDKMLSERLKELEAEGLLTRTVIPDTPVRVEYHLTEMGQALREVVGSIQDWSRRWLPDPDTAAT
ncbi:MAG TPA: helix-turn-helix domain-containing protein [Deinococcales bacterium]|nr:helix-turn-helix domain-containing protein [Deinococcales bacterium]